MARNEYSVENPANLGSDLHLARSCNACTLLVQKRDGTEKLGTFMICGAPWRRCALDPVSSARRAAPPMAPSSSEANASVLPSAQMGESATAKHPANASAMVSTAAKTTRYEGVCVLGGYVYTKHQYISDDNNEAVRYAGASNSSSKTKIKPRNDNAKRNSSSCYC